MKHKHYERRKSKDFLTKLINYSAMLGWVSIVFTTLVFHLARPDKTGDRHWKLGNRTTWDTETAQFLLYLFAFGLSLSILGVFVNILRNKRKSDIFHINLIVLAVTSLAGIILYFFNF